MTNTETPTAYGELTNTCTCTLYDMETGAITPATECDGFCWESELEFFGECVRNFLALSDTFRVSGIRLWNGEVGGVFTANTVAEFVRGITVDSSWILRYRVFRDRVEFSLAHHDAPTGSASVVVPLVECSDDDCDNYTRLEVEFPEFSPLCEECVESQLGSYENARERAYYRE